MTHIIDFWPFCPPNFSMLAVSNGLEVIDKPYKTIQIELLIPIGRSVSKKSRKTNENRYNKPFSELVLSSELAYDFYPKKYIEKYKTI